MSNLENAATVTADNADAIANVPATTDASTSAPVAAPVTEQPARKPRAPRAAKPAPVAAPVTEQPAADFGRERAAAALAVGAFYTSGVSMPFKSAATRLADFNPANAKAPSPRTAAMLAAMLAYAPDGAIKRDGTFSRGCFRVPAKLLDASAKPGDVLAAMPESGCLGNVAGRCVTHVSGPIGGKQARDGIFRLNFAAVRAELTQLGDAVAKPALAVLDKLAPVKPSKRAA